jgi:hypothetical protein
MSKITKVVLPAQTVEVDTPTGIDPIWYERLQQLATFVTLFSEVDPATLTNGQVLIWNAAQKKFLPGAN